MILLNLDRKPFRIKPDGAPLDLGDLLRVLYAVAALNGSGLRLKAAMRSAEDLHQRVYPSWIWDAAVAEFVKHGREVRA